MTSLLKSASRVLLAAVLSVVVVQRVQAERTTTYLHTDGLGSVVAASDESGDVLWRKSYAPYGEQIDSQADDEALSYTGKPHDADLGLTYFGARYYDPVVGRFLSPDPVGFVEGNAMSFNRYLYVNNNPYKYVDPDGRYAIAVFRVLELLGRTWSSIAGAVGGVYVAEEVIQPALNEADAGDDGGAADRGTDGAADSQPAEAEDNRSRSRAQGVPEHEIGPSGKPKRHFPHHSSRKEALDSSRQPSGTKPEIHERPTTRGQRQHFHDADNRGVHHTFGPRKAKKPGS